MRAEVTRARPLARHYPRLPPLRRGADRQPLPHEPRPVLRASRTARLAVCSQAPGTQACMPRALPSPTRSGDRLRDWMGVSPQEFYDEARVAIVPMGFCFPGQDDEGRRPAAAERVRQALASQPCSIGCRSSSSCLRSAPMRSVFISAPRWEPVSQETMLDWRKHLRRKNASARPAAAASVLAQQCMADATILVRGRASAGAAPRGAQDSSRRF